MSGLLPRAGDWNLTVEAPDEGISVGLSNFEVIDDGTGRAFVELDIPATRLEGVVTDPQGNPVSGATIRVRSRLTRRIERIETDAQGRFLVRGMAEEIVSVRAEKVGRSRGRTTVNDGTRARIRSITTFSSIRASGAPLQVWGPCPNAMWRLGRRSSRHSPGSSNAVSS